MIVTEHCDLMLGCMFSTWRFSGFSGFQSKHELGGLAGDCEAANGRELEVNVSRKCFDWWVIHLLLGYIATVTWMLQT